MTRPMKFLHVTTFYPPYSFGGDALYLYRLCHELGEMGHRVDVIHCVDSYHLLHPAPPEIDFAPHPNVKTWPLRSGKGWLSPLITHQTGGPGLKRREIQRILDSERWDVIHYHNMSLIGPGALAMESRQGPAVKMYTAHEHWLVCPMHVLWKFNERPCEKPECFSCCLRGRRPPQPWRWSGLLSRSARHVDMFMAPSRFTADMHAARGFERPVSVLPYFVPRPAKLEAALERPHARPYFLFVGRLEVIKGLQVLIDLWKDIEEYDLLVAGSGVHGEELRRRAAGNPRIHFLGARSQEQLGALYRYALACIVPSITYETFGIVCIEAFLQKTPVIAHDLGALGDVVRESGGGLLYRTPRELRNAIKTMAGSEELRRELAQRGEEAYRRLWTREAHLDLYFSYLRQAATARFGSPPWEEPSGKAPAPAASMIH
jgi:glycosyltransferase involved in cell wall biosynthesis